MKIIHKYILSETLRNITLAIFTFSFLFLIFDFFDRIDNILREDAPISIIISYFLLKLPEIFVTTLPIAMLVACLFTIGVLAKNSEFTAMRASGATVFWIARPIYILAFCLSVFSIIIGETLVPYSARRVKEIYDIDIRAKDKKGNYSQDNFWWRDKDSFYSTNVFDSRTNTLHELSKFQFNDSFEIQKRINSEKVNYVSPLLGWSMNEVKEYDFINDEISGEKKFRSLPLPDLQKVPKDFYDAKTDPLTMSYTQLSKFIKEQGKNGLSTKRYLSDLYSKLSFPFVTLIITILVIPFALKPARTGSMAASFIAALIIGFTYYVIHSLSLALGRADIWSPLLAAWMANLISGIIGLVFLMGAEAPH